MAITMYDYEIPDGWSTGLPEVLVTHSVINKIGMPEVNYDSLHQFLTDDLGVPYGDPTTIKLTRIRGPVGGRVGFHTPFTRTFHVNAPLAEEVYAGSGGTMRVVAHEGRHRSDTTNRKFMSVSEAVLRLTSL